MIMNLTRWNYLGGFGGYASDYSHGLNGANPEGEQLPHQPTPAKAENANGSNGNHPVNRNDNRPTASVAAIPMSPEAAKLFAAEAAKLIENQQKLIEGSES